MPDHHVAHAVADEIDFLDAVEVVDDLGQRFGVFGDFLLRGGIGDVENLVPPVGLQIAAKLAHVQSRTANSVQHDHGLTLHGGQAALGFDFLQGRFAFVESAPSIAKIVFIQQAVMAGKHVLLDSPLVKEQFIGPKLLPAQGWRPEVQVPYRSHFLGLPRLDQTQKILNK